MGLQDSVILHYNMHSMNEKNCNDWMGRLAIAVPPALTGDSDCLSSLLRLLNGRKDVVEDEMYLRGHMHINYRKLWVLTVAWSSYLCRLQEQVCLLKR